MHLHVSASLWKEKKKRESSRGIHHSFMGRIQPMAVRQLEVALYSLMSTNSPVLLQDLKQPHFFQFLGPLSVKM